MSQSIKKCFFFLEDLNSINGEKEAASLPRAEALMKRLDSIFRMLCLLIRGWYLKITMEHEKNGLRNLKRQSSTSLIDRVEGRWYVLRGN